MDEIDRQILECLQEDALLTLDELGARVGLTSTPCWRRVQRLEASGVIRRRVALLDPEKLNLPLTAFVAIRTNRHEPDWLARFARAVVDIPEVVEFYRMSGEVDYLLRVVVPDIAAYDGVYKRLITAVELYDVSTSFSMERIKYTTALPLSYATQ